MHFVLTTEKAANLHTPKANLLVLVSYLQSPKPVLLSQPG